MDRGAHCTAMPAPAARWHPKTACLLLSAFCLLLFLPALGVEASLAPRFVNREEALALPLGERLGLKWEAQVVSFPVEFHVGRCLRASLLLVGPQGKPVPFQVSDPVSHDRPGRFLKSGRVSFVAGLEPHEAKE